MKSRIIILIGAALATVAYAGYDPIALTPASFTQDIVVEKTAPPPLAAYTTTTLDQGTNNFSNTLFESGYVPSMLWWGIPTAGSTFTSQADANRSYIMPPTFRTNNVAFIGAKNAAGTSTLQTQVAKASLTVNSPRNCAAISVLYAGGGGGTVNVTVHHADNSTETSSFTSIDWFNASTTYAWIARGRVDVSGSAPLNTLASTTQTKLFSAEVLLSNSGSPVTKVDFEYTSGDYRVFVLAISGSADGSTYTPMAVSGFNYDAVVEAGAPYSFVAGSTATLDGGTNNTGNTYFEQGFDPVFSGTTGLPHPGGTLAIGTTTFQMPSTYVGNNSLLIGGGISSGTFTFTAAAAYTSLSILTASGNGPVGMNYVVTYSDSSTSSGTVSSPDWFAANASNAFTAGGRINVGSCGFDIRDGSRLWAVNITGLTAGLSVTSVSFTYSSGGRAVIYAISGQSTAGGGFSPIAVNPSSYNADMIIEKEQIRCPGSIFTATTATMDLGTNNANWTWFERGWLTNGAAKDSGLPPAGSIIASLQDPSRRYQMPSTYTGPNSILIDVNHKVANITPAVVANYSAFALLTGGGTIGAANTMTNECVLQHADGTSETNVFYGYDWFNTTVSPAFIANGRIDTRFGIAGSLFNSPQMPRLFETIFAINNIGSPVTNIQVRYKIANGSTWTTYVMAVSATAGAVAPVFALPTPAYKVMESTNLSYAVPVGGTAPFSYQWQKSADGVTWANLSNSGNVSGATSSNMVITTAGWTNTGWYRVIASNVAGSTTNDPGYTWVISGLPTVTVPADPVVAYQPNGGTSPDAESAPHAIDGLTSKYYNGAAGTTPFVGPIGFEVAPPRIGSIVTAVRLFAGNDATERDPANYLLEGSLDGGYNYTTISSGTVAMPDGRNAAALALDPLNQYMFEVHFANTTPYTKYRFSTSATKANSSSIQVGEVQLLGLPSSNSVATILAVPQNTTANENGKATFTVSAIGPGTLSYKWYDVSAGDPGTLIPGQTTPTLTLSNVTLAMNGNTYRVEVINANGSVISPAVATLGAQLTVASGGPVVVTDLPAEGIVYAGRTAVLPVEVSGSLPITYQWQKDSVNLTDTSRITGSQSSVLTITQSQLSDSGAYQLATIHNAYGDAQSGTENLIVQEIPALTTTGAGWSLNGTPTPATISDKILTLTTGNGNTARSAWYNFPLYIGAFKASFVYQDVNTGGADGMALVIQNDSRGLNAVGGGGGGLGFLGVTNSAALELNIYGSSGFAFNINGAVGGYAPTTPVNIASGELIKVDLSYQDGVMHLVLSNTATAATFTTNLTVGDLKSVVGKETAYVGLTGADGGTASVQTVSEFKYIPVPTLTAKQVGGSVVLSWPASVGGYAIQSCGSLSTPNWADAGLTVTVVGDRYQATINDPSGDKFYRLWINNP